MTAKAIDRATGRPYGDHGQATDAINFAIDQLGSGDQDAFLRCWRDGDLSEFPEFYTYLRDRGL
jgi:hypothetical protein